MVHTSTSNPIQPGSLTDWRSAGFRYFAYNFFLQQRFGRRVQKVSIDAGFTCPNVDGAVATGGCNFCDNRSFSPSRRVPRQSIIEQIDDGIRRLKRRYNCDHFTAYFQPATNTYAPVDRLRPLYEQALSHPQVVGMAIGTRLDAQKESSISSMRRYGSESSDDAGHLRSTRSGLAPSPVGLRKPPSARAVSSRRASIVGH